MSLATVELLGAGVGIAQLQVDPGVVQRMVVVILPVQVVSVVVAVGQQAGQAQLVAVAVDGPLARRGSELLAENGVQRELFERR